MSPERRHRSAVAWLIPTLVLTGALLYGSNIDAGRQDALLSALGDYEQTQAALHRDAISVRVGLLHTYDPLVDDVARLETARDRLRAAAQPFPDVQPVIAGLARSADRQSGLVETLKSDSALLHNSLAYFSLTAAPSPGGRAGGRLDALAAAMLRLTLDTSPEIQDQVSRRLSAVQIADGRSEPIRILLAHARMLQRLLPRADHTLRALLASDRVGERQALRAEITAQRAQIETWAARFRIGLFAMSAVLVTLLVRLGLRLRSHVAQLSRRARLERIAAEFAANLVHALPGEVDATVTTGLAALADELGADRAYLVGEGPYADGERWCRAGPEFWTGRPEQLLDLPLSHKGVLHAEDGSAASALEREALKAAGARSLCLAWATNEAGRRIVLGLDSTSRRLRLDGWELEVVRLALGSTEAAMRRRALERNRSELEHRLQLASRLEAVGALASGIAHNFNNILGAIRGYAEMAGADASPSSATARRLREIQRAVGRGRDLVDGILAFGRRRAETPRTVDVAALMVESARLLEAGRPRGSQFVLDALPDDLGGVIGDGGDLQQVVLNLGVNASRAMRGRGEVRIGAAAVRLREPRLAITGTLAPGAYVRLRVEDDGDGIDPSLLAQIFEPFFTTRSDGHGLGLATAREIIRDHGGAIDVASASGRGSRFDVWLPQARPGRLGDAGVRGGTLLLLGETREAVLQSEDVLAALGYEPAGYAGPDAAIHALRASPARFRAAICRAPRASVAIGWAGRLRRAAPDLPLVVVSYPDPQLTSQALELGRCAVTSWPLRPRTLAQALHFASLGEVEPSGTAAEGAAPDRLPDTAGE